MCSFRGLKSSALALLYQVNTLGVKGLMNINDHIDQVDQLNKRGMKLEELVLQHSLTSVSLINISGKLPAE